MEYPAAKCEMKTRKPLRRDATPMHSHALSHDAILWSGES